MQNVVYSLMAKTVKKSVRAVKSSAAAVVEEALPLYTPLRTILGGHQSSVTSPSGEYDLIALTRDGVKKSSLKSLAAYLGISMEQLSGLLHSSYRNIQRKPDNALLDSLKSEKVLELASFVQRGIQVIGSRTGFTQWLQTPLLSLRNQTPLQFLDTSFGIQLLLRTLGRLEQGVYA
ncbi:MAG: DUF2384 domain-containing protein [Chitinophagaceae bacterium]|nr:DUF2384 domain-containing protein [Chitinophagaceae bacterium]